MPTVNLSTVWDITSAIKPPRVCFLDFPIGCPSKKPGQPELQREILKAVLAQAPRCGDVWSMYEMPFQWSDDGSRAWEEELKEIYRQGLRTVKAHMSRTTPPAVSRSLARRKNSQSAATARASLKKDLIGFVAFVRVASTY